MGLVQKAFSDIITFSRSSNATRVGPTGVLEYAPHNLILQSQTFDNASWSADNASIVANSVAAPDGTVTADKLVDTATSAIHNLYQILSSTSGVNYTFSLYVKKAERPFAYIRVGGISTNPYAVFNMDTGTLSASGNLVSSSITSVGNGWYRIAVTVTADSSVIAVNYGAAPVGYTLNASNIPVYTGDGTSGIYLWGAQLAVGPYALDYVPTTSAAVYGPRFDYDGSGVTIVEPVSRNLVTYSQDFSNAAWIKRSITLTASQSSPDGGSSAFLAVPSTGASADMYNPVSASSAVYTVSVFAKASGKTWFYVLTAQGAGTSLAWFNVSTGVVGTVSGSGVTATITAAGNGWYRCTVTQTSASNYCQFGISDADNSLSVTGSGSNGILLWGAQLEVGSTATAYMVSGASNGFRAVPVVSGSATARGLLVEEQRTNLLVRSEEFDNAAWTKTRLTITANSIAAPDGTVSADTFTSTSTTQPIECYGLVSISASTTYTYSAFFKSGTHTKALLRCYNGGSTTTPLAIFDLSAKSTIATYGNVTATSVQDYGNGWVRCIMTFTSTGTSGNPQLNGLADTYTVSTDFNFVSSMSTNGSVYAWGAQVETGSFATSYIPTLASTVTRSADVASVNTLSPFYNQTEGTLYAEADIIGKSIYNNPSGFLTDGTENNAIYTLNNPGTAVVVSGGATQFDSTAVGSTSVNTVYKAALAFKANDFATSYNGSTPTTDTSGTVPTVSSLYLGRRVSSSGSLNGHIRRIAYYPRRLQNAELQALTA